MLVGNAFRNDLSAEIHVINVQVLVWVLGSAEPRCGCENVLLEDLKRHLAAAQQHRGWDVLRPNEYGRFPHPEGLPGHVRSGATLILVHIP